MKPWLIAHRGAQCDGRENTIQAFKATNKYPLGWVELDLHVTKDNIVICHHDFNVRGLKIKDHTFTELKTKESELTTFDEAIKVIKKAPLIVEIKPTGVVKHISSILKSNPTWQVASFKHAVIKELIAADIQKKRIFLIQSTHPFEELSWAIKMGLGGFGINSRHMMPLLVWKAKRHGLKIYTYTVNLLFLARIFRFYYPYVWIVTNRPNVFAKLK